MTDYHAPAKLNLSLLVHPPRPDGYHHLESMVQTIEWCDVLAVEPGEGSDELETEIEDNLVDKALRELRRDVRVPPLRMSLDKQIPVAAGMGGGSSDAAAALLAGTDAARLDEVDLDAVARRVGADVSLFLTGGTLMMSGTGERIESLQPAEGFVVAVVTPSFGMSTVDVYRKWDELEGPEGEAAPDGSLPPWLRGRMPMRNDLLPAALAVEPSLGDFMADLRAVWATPVFLTGSGSACFAYFATVDEASDAVTAVEDRIEDGRGTALRGLGVERIRVDPE